MRRPNATDDIIHEVAALTAAGHSSRAVQQATGINRRTVSRWVQRPDIAQVISDNLDQLVLAYSERWKQRFERTEGDDKFLTGSQLPIDAGILFDKYTRLHANSQPGPSVTVNLIAQRSDTMRPQITDIE